MDLQSLIKGFPTTPFLFVGSGFSRRYYNLPDWAGLLREFAKRLNDDEFAYNGYLSRARIGLTKEEVLLPRVAELLMKDFDARWFADPSFRKLKEEYLQFVHQEQSPFKVEIAQYIDEHSVPVEDKAEELALLKAISSKSLAGIITTNYDCLLERETDGYKSFVGQEELVFSAIQGWAEIYKIHGSITNPGSIVITESDYQHFMEYCPYLASKLMTIFMEYPIIFIGYSLSDPNVRIILQSIVKCLTKENLERLQDRFIYVEWEANKNEVEISSAAITIDDKVIRMTSVKTDNFAALYQALAEKRASLPAKLIRLFKQEFYTYALTNQPTVNLRVAGIDDERIGDEELVLAIGKASTLGVRGLKGLTAEEWYRHIVLHDLDFTADEILDNAYPPLISKNNSLPLNMLLNEASKQYPECEAKAIRSFDAAMNRTIRKQRSKRVIPHRSVNGILEDFKGDRKKILANISYLYEKEIDCDELELYLKSCYEEADFYSTLGSNERSDFHRLIKIFDWMKYGKK